MAQPEVAGFYWLVLRSRLLWILILLLASALGWAGTRHAWAAAEVRVLLSLCQGLDPDFARQVVTAKDPEWRAYVQSIGVRGLTDADQIVLGRLNASSFEEYRRIHRPLERMELRIVTALSEQFDFHGPLECVRFMRMGDERWNHEMRSLGNSLNRIEPDRPLPPLERRRRIQDLRAAYLRRGAAHWKLRADQALAALHAELGERPEYRAALESVVEDARRLDEPFFQAQVLGELSDVHWRAGEVDSARMRLREAHVIARRHQFLDQEARILRFEAELDLELGHLARAAVRLTELQRLSDLPSAGSARVRMQLDYAKFLGRCGCWELVDRSLRRLPPLFRRYKSESLRSDFTRYAVDVAGLRAQIAFAAGDVATGDSLMRNLTADPISPPIGVRSRRAFQIWSAGLLACDRPSEALDVCARGIALCDSLNVADHEFHLWRAQALERLGRIDESRRAWESVRARALTERRMDHHLRQDIELLGARLAHDSGDPGVTRAILIRCQTNFERRLVGPEKGPLNYLELDEARSLRMAWHELGRLSAEQGYQYECRWRSLSQLSRGGRETLAGLPGGSGQRRRPALGRRDVHLVYLFTGGLLLRWTTTASHVALDTLALSPRDCLAGVRRALELLQTETPGAGEPLGTEARAALEPLSRLLLPPALATGGRARRIYISPDGALWGLPFEALPVMDQEGAPPLACCAEVAYAHGERESVDSRGGRAVIVADPEVSPELRRRYSAVGPLLFSPAEVNTAMARWPDARVLRGPQATMRNVLTHWPQSSAIYLAAHHIRDPDAPFLGFVPLAGAANDADGEAMLEIADVRALDLSRCRVVVLAACASGAPYGLTQRPGPTLGEAFLDAGARSVIESFWEVGDAETSEFMQALLSDPALERDNVTALSRARLAVMSSPGGRDPRVWSAWSVHVALPMGSQNGFMIADGISHR